MVLGYALLRIGVNLIPISFSDATLRPPNPPCKGGSKKSICNRHLGNWYNVSLAVETAATRNFTCLEQVTLREGFAYKNQVKIQACMAQNKMLEAVDTALPVLKLLEVEFPQKPSQSDIQLGLVIVSDWLMPGMRGDELLILIH